ncbi:MAG: hypothetical protein OJF51_002259 [Nitrospira sp.]|nr:MAG: hypothetical protein OJF51_002259 [Nitrospira sp.]
MAKQRHSAGNIDQGEGWDQVRHERRGRYHTMPSASNNQGAIVLLMRRIQESVEE